MSIRAALVLGLCSLGLGGCSSSPDAAMSASMGVTEKNAQVHSEGELNALMDKLCKSMAAVKATVTTSVGTTCPLCTTSDDASAADAADKTFATLDVTAPFEGPVTIRATALAGVTFAAGNRPAISLNMPNEPSNTWTITLRTLLAGAVTQEEVVQDHSLPGPSGRNILGILAKGSFDAFEAEFDADRVTATPPPDVNISVDNPTTDFQVQVHELCSDFDFDRAQ